MSDVQIDDAQTTVLDRNNQQRRGLMIDVRRLTERLVTYLHGLSPLHSLLIALLLFATAVAIDAAAGGAVSAIPFYLLVVLFVVWNCGGIWAGIFLIATLVAAIAIGEVYGHPFISRELFLIDVAGRILIYLFMLSLAGLARRAFAREQALARADVLTGLANRISFYERLEFEIERQKRSLRPLALAYFDCDNFKNVNDKFGHAAGDQVLKEIAAILLRDIRKIDLAARLGGDEFALLLPETDAKEAAMVIEKLRAALREIQHVRNKTISFSFGLVVARSMPQSADWLIDQADRLMFKVKRAGKDGVQQLVFDEPAGATGQSKSSARQATENQPQSG